MSKCDIRVDVVLVALARPGAGTVTKSATGPRIQRPGKVVILGILNSLVQEKRTVIVDARGILWVQGEYRRVYPCICIPEY